MTTRADLHQLLHHSWSVPLKRAAIIQAELAPYVRLTPLSRRPQVMAGIDFASDENHYFVSVVVMDFRNGKVIEIQSAEGITSFPDTHGYLAFRVGSLVIQAARQLIHEPDLYFVNGPGVCHSRLCGVASHIGLRLGKATIGCTLERQAGHYDPPGEKEGDYSVVRFVPRAPGVVLRSRAGVNPIFVSPGHMVDLLGAVEQTMRACLRYRLPEPLRRAHIEAGRFMRQRLALTKERRAGK